MPSEYHITLQNTLVPTEVLKRPPLERKLADNYSRLKFVCLRERNVFLDLYFVNL